MSVCPNCGASGNNGKFCESCGSPLPVEQPVPVQPYYSFIGFIVSTIGVIIAFVKKQKGKVLGIIGMILSLLMTVGVIIFFANADKISEFFSNANGAGYSFEEWLFDVSYDGKIEMISETEWIEKNSGSCLVFEADDKFKYYWDYRDLNNYYYTGTYEIYFGYEAMDVLENKYPQYGYTGSQICDDISFDPVSFAVDKSFCAPVHGENQVVRLLV